MAPFSAIAEPTEAAYADLAADLPANTEARLFRPGEEPVPRGGEELDCFPMLQMVASGVPDGGDTVGSLLSPSRQPGDDGSWRRPGPTVRFAHAAARTLSGIWHEGRLVAMAGERLRVPGHVELSAICVHRERRKHYVALTRQLMRLAVEAGELPLPPRPAAQCRRHRQQAPGIRDAPAALW
jgi:hypothetical protein